MIPRIPIIMAKDRSTIRAMMCPGSKIGSKPRVLAEDTVILHALHTSSLGATDSFIVSYTILQPQVRDAEADRIVDDGRHIFRRPEDIDQVQACASLFPRGCLRGFKIGKTGHAQHSG